MLFHLLSVKIKISFRFSRGKRFNTIVINERSVFNLHLGGKLSRNGTSFLQ